MLNVDDARSSGTNARWTAIYDDIKAAILAHNIAPGTKLPEDELCEVYSVSRTLVRAALQALSHDHLVQLEPNRGAFVAKPTKREAREVFEARALIEPKVAAMAAALAKPVDVRALRRHLDEEHKAVHEGRQGDAVLLSARFHEAIAEIADQSILIDFVRLLCSRSALIISLYSRRSDTLCDSRAHRALVDAIASHSEIDAFKLMTDHLDDLLSGIDISEREISHRRLTEILGRS
ncbi:MAG TPA: GntR family transcriptional regulator [Devosia sp.]|jgi:DNA-binding GntR family transcriptional regulator|uniref:GntR family transcriptional regulator n=1 Tax=Devosia sp. TaxID=1871048 RepID=UPI002DDD21B8|nr:GntR family transcriptional regulator [Devosia sp.]HEV2517184.1 GntR family transcriptional regulator [Devosia sp.]